MKVKIMNTQHLDIRGSHLDTIKLNEDITVILWVDNTTGRVNSPVVRIEQDSDVIIVATPTALDELIAILTQVRDDQR